MYLVVLLITCLFAIANSATININSTVDCQAVWCDLLNPAIWEGSVTPTSIDDVIIDVRSGAYYLNGPAQFNSLSTQNVSLQINSSSFTINQAASFMGGFLYLDPNCSLKATEININNAVGVSPWASITGNVNLYSPALVSFQPATTVTGDLNNYGGTVQIEDGTSLLVDGNFNQWAGATLNVIHIEPSNAVARLTVTQTASVNGTLSYSVDVNPSSSTDYLIVTAQGGEAPNSNVSAIVGSFATLSATNGVLSLDYSRPNQIYLTYRPAPADPFLWSNLFWVAVSAGVVLLLAIIIVIMNVIRSKRRRAYQPIV